MTIYAWGDKVITEVQNPVTRSIVRFEPSYVSHTDEDLDQLIARFNQFCADAWSLPNRRNPDTLDPYRVLDGTEPLDVPINA